jgi:hypothetical protein
MYVAAVVRGWGTSCLSPGCVSPGCVCHLVVCHLVVCHLVVVTWLSSPGCLNATVDGDPFDVCSCCCAGMGYVLSVTWLSTGLFVTGLFVTGLFVCHRVVRHRVVRDTSCLSPR